MNGWTVHLLIAPVLIPLIAAAVMVMMGDQRRTLRSALAIGSTLLLLGVAVTLLVMADNPVETVRIYRLGNWPSLFGIVLVLDRLTAIMLVLTSILGLAALSFSLSRWHRIGVHFQPLLQIQLMGLNGAFLTGDLFNLFVFFEVMLAASYGLALHGSGASRLRVGLHYIAINLTASLLFLIGVSIIYGVAGTLNMADLAARVSSIPRADRALFEVGAAILGVAFLTKAAMWPVGLWLPATYAAASAPAAAILSILSKVGIYAVLRMWLLVFGEDAGASSGFAGTWLMVGGLCTIAFGCVALLAAQNAGRLAGASVLMSSGTLLTVISIGEIAVTAGALFYLVTSVLGIAALFLVIEIIEREREAGADVLAVTREAFGEGEEAEPDEELPGAPIPAATAILGLSFLGCALILAGLPPFSGFLAKLAILSPLFGDGGVTTAAWVVLVALLLSGLVTIVATTRWGIDAFWASPVDQPKVQMNEVAPIVLLLTLCAVLTVQAGPAMRYMSSTAEALHHPRAYIGGVLPAVVDDGLGKVGP